MIKKTLITISYVVLGIFLTVYFTYLNLPCEKILFKNLPENIDMQASVEPTFLGGLSLENVDLKFPNDRMPIMSKVSEVHLGISWLSLLMGNLKLIISLTNWSDQNMALKNALLEDVKIEMDILSVLKLMRQDFSDKTPFLLKVVSNKKTNDIQLNLDWTFQIQPRTFRMYPFSAKAKLKLAGSFRQIEPLIESLGLDLGKPDKEGFYNLEINESTLGGPPLPPQLPPNFNRPGPSNP